MSSNRKDSRWERKAKLLREYADRNGFQIVKAFEDVETAKASGRIQFSEMMTWFRRNRSCRVLLVEKQTAFTGTCATR